MATTVPVCYKEANRYSASQLLQCIAGYMDWPIGSAPERSIDCLMQRVSKRSSHPWWFRLSKTKQFRPQGIFLAYRKMYPCLVSGAWCVIALVGQLIRTILERFYTGTGWFSNLPCIFFFADFFSFFWVSFVGFHRGSYMFFYAFFTKIIYLVVYF